MGNIAVTLTMWDIPNNQLQTFIDLLNSTIEEWEQQQHPGKHFDRSKIVFTESEDN